MLVALQVLKDGALPKAGDIRDRKQIFSRRKEHVGFSSELHIAGTHPRCLSSVFIHKWL